jgi:membrane dipeptidase
METLMRGTLRAAAFAAAVLCAGEGVHAQQNVADVTDSVVRAVHEAARPADAHADILVSTTPDIYRTDDGQSQLTLNKLEAGGMAIQTLALQSPNGPDTPAGIAAAHAEIDAKLAMVRGMAEAFPERLGLARSYADIERLNAQGRIAILLSFQNAYGLGTNIELVDDYVSEGVRIFAFNHAGNNAFSDSSRPAVPGDAPNGGLSELGREAIRRLNDFGVVIDVSQLTPAALRQTIELSRAPVLATHSAVRAMVDETRNLLDHEMDAIAGGGGAVCIPPFNTYLAPRPPDFVSALGDIRQEYGLPREFRGVLDDSNRLAGANAGEYVGRALASVPRATLEDYVDHIDYVVERVGIDHVCIGTDFDHGAGIIGYADAGEAENLTRALLERGYTPEEVAKIWSGNFLRVLQAAETAARRSE